MAKKSALYKAMEQPGKDYIKQLKMQHDLNKFGKDVPGGKAWSVQDMQRFFNRKK